MDYQFEYSNQIALPWIVQHMKPFLFPDLSKKQARIRKMMSGVVASLDKQPVGLILSTYGSSKAQARVHSFVVHPDHRNKGIGTRLLTSLEENLASEGCETIDGSFREHWKSTDALRNVLAKCGWILPEQDLIIVRGEARKVLKLFMDDQLTLPEEYHFHPFTGLTEEQQGYIRKRKEKDNWYPDILDPFVYPATINPVTSLALMRGDEVVGWVISHMISKDLNEFTSLFIDPSVRSYKMAHLLMRETINRQHDHGIPNFLITSKYDNYVMARFLIRHAPHTDVFFTRTYRTMRRIPAQ